MIISFSYFFCEIIVRKDKNNFLFISYLHYYTDYIQIISLYRYILLKILIIDIILIYSVIKWMNNEFNNFWLKKIFEIVKIIEFDKKYTDSEKRKWKYAGCRDYI